MERQRTSWFKGSGGCLVELNGPKHLSLPEVVNIPLLGPLQPLEPLVPGWRATSDLQRLKQILEAPEDVVSG